MKNLLDKMPIHRDEMAKFFLTSSMMMIVVYVYSVLRASKDAIVVSLMGSELISTIKLWGVLPSAILFMLVYTKLVDVFSRVKLFHMIIWFFVGFFGLFAFVLFPNVDKIHPNLDHLIEALPYLKYVLIMISGWSYTLFYILSELWGSVVLSLLFWQLANQITNVSEAKRFYPLFGLLGQVGLISAGYLITLFTEVNKSAGGWDKSLSYISISILICGVALSVIFTLLSKKVGVQLVNGEISVSGKTKKKIKMGFVESLKYILSSKYIGLITLLILCYGVSINLVEGVWKKSLELRFIGSPNDYASFMGNVQIFTGVATALAMLSGSFLLRVIKWRTAALLTPIMILITGVLFFLFMVYQEDLEPYVSTLAVTALVIAVWSGAAQNVLSKATKYSFFDPTKEMAYIPAEDEVKVKGKAAADVIGGRLGKSGGAIIQYVMLQAIIGSTLISLAPNLFAIFLIVMLIWFFAVFALEKEFNKKTAEQEKTMTQEIKIAN